MSAQENAGFLKQVEQSVKRRDVVDKVRLCLGQTRKIQAITRNFVQALMDMNLSSKIPRIFSPISPVDGETKFIGDITRTSNQNDCTDLLMQCVPTDIRLEIEAVVRVFCPDTWRTMEQSRAAQRAAHAQLQHMQQPQLTFPPITVGPGISSPHTTPGQPGPHSPVPNPGNTSNPAPSRPLGPYVSKRKNP
ncbi:MAG: hypothetical protein AAB489_02870 [Patescibacteria group bacterium]